MSKNTFIKPVSIAEEAIAPTHVDTPKTPKVAVDAVARNVELVNDLFQNMRSASNPIDRMKAFKTLVHICRVNPKRPILDKAFQCFKENRSEEFLNEYNALQYSDHLQPKEAQEVQTFYSIMTTLANPRKGSQIHIGTVSNIFNPDFSTWVSVKCNQLNLNQKVRIL